MGLEFGTLRDPSIVAASLGGEREANSSLGEEFCKCYEFISLVTSFFRGFGRSFQSERGREIGDELLELPQNSSGAEGSLGRFQVTLFGPGIVKDLFQLMVEARKGGKLSNENGSIAFYQYQHLQEICQEI